MVCEEIEKATSPVTLIGHSRAGIVISQVAERIPDKISKLVYLCAFFIPNGEPMVATALSDTNSILVNNLVFNESEGWHIPNFDSYKPALYNDCSEEDVALCSSLLTHEPNLPVATPLDLTSEKYGAVQKVYIFTTNDNAITHSAQKKMVSRQKVDETFELNAGHSPFLSQPHHLAQILLNLNNKQEM